MSGHKVIRRVRGGLGWTRRSYALFPKKKTEQIVRMDQKLTKRQNERSTASRKMDLAPFNIQATICFSLFPIHGVVVMTVLGRDVIFHSALSFISKPESVRSICTAYDICRSIVSLRYEPVRDTNPELLSFSPILPHVVVSFYIIIFTFFKSNLDFDLPSVRFLKITATSNRKFIATFEPQFGNLAKFYLFSLTLNLKW